MDKDQIPKIIDAFCNLNVVNFEDLIAQINPYLITKKYVTKTFGANLIKREKQYPTGLKFDNFNVAIPHTDAQYVIKSGIIVIKLKKPITMLHMASTNNYLPIKYLFLLLVKEPKKQISYLTTLMKYFQMPDFGLSLQHKNTIKELKTIF